MTVLIGLGLGPGDPELLTLRAVRILREADAVFVPGGIAQKLVAPYREAEVLSFPMTGDEATSGNTMEAGPSATAFTSRKNPMLPTSAAMIAIMNGTDQLGVVCLSLIPIRLL